jgi:hypothetical protein
MKRAYQIRIMAWLVGVIATFDGVTIASAGTWACGCEGQLGDRQLIFNRYSLFVVDSKQKLRGIRKLMAEKIDDLVTAPKTEFERVDFNSGLESPLTFTLVDDSTRKLMLTEQSSRKISGRSRQVCGRDETTDIFRKVYRYERDGEAPRNITMECIEYQLTTRGGRPGC